MCAQRKSAKFAMSYFNYCSKPRGYAAISAVVIPISYCRSLGHIQVVVKQFVQKGKVDALQGAFSLSQGRDWIRQMAVHTTGKSHIPWKCEKTTE